MRLIFARSAPGQHDGREGDHRATCKGRYHVGYVGVGEGRKVGCAHSAKHNEVELPSSAFVEQFLQWIAEHRDGLHFDLALKLFWNKREQLGLNLFDAAAGENLVALLRRDDMMPFGANEEWVLPHIW